jgi:hypothetical protein
MRKLLSAILITGFLLAGVFRVQAQESARAEIIQISTDSFPTITALLDIYDTNGKFVSAVDAANLTVLEDGQPIPVSTLEEQEIGAQIVVAINPSPPMDTRDALGISRYDLAVETLRIWAENRPLEPRDKLSLVATAGPLLVNASPSEWRNSLVSFQPDARTAIPGLQSLSFALDLIEGEQDLSSGMKRSILFITSHLPDQASVNELETLTERALLLNTRVNVWMLDSEAYFVHFSANSLKSLALQTGGDYFAFSGTESLPNPENYFSHLRHLYTFSYESQLTTGGSHRLAAHVQYGGLDMLSPDQNFGLDIQPPNPFLLAPPAQIVRQAPPEDPYNTEILLPTSQNIEFLVEFPDGHPRPITRATLLVDEEKVAEITSPPFENFQWQLDKYTQSGEHSLQIEVEDSLGLTKTSLGIPLTLTVVQPPSGVLAFFGRNGSLLTVGVIAVSGLLLAAILLVGGRRSLQSLAARRQAKAAYHDPVTQPIPASKPTESKRKRRISLQGWARNVPKRKKAIARLTRLNEKGSPLGGTPIPLTGEEMSFGSDPVKVTFVLDDPSVSPRHAKLVRNENGQFLLFDQNSVAGTWINFEKAASEGSILTDGDLILFGLLRYRFDLLTNPINNSPEVRVEKELS